MPEDEQRRILTQLARHLLMEATALGDVRVAMFILLQERMGKDPARTLADGVIAANKRAAQPAPAPRTPSPSPRPPARPTIPTCARCSGWRAACAASCSRSMRRFTPLWRRTRPSLVEEAAPEPEPPQRQRRSPRPSSTPVLSDYQSRAIEALLLLKNAAPAAEPPARPGALEASLDRPDQGRPWLPTRAPAPPRPRGSRAWASAGADARGRHGRY